MQNMPVIVLPPDPVPRTLTANVRVRTLQDHFLAFLDANNPNGFDAEIVAQISDNAIGDLMLLAALKDAMSVSEFKLEAKKLKKLSSGVIGHSHCLALLSRLFGYANWHEALQCVRDGLLDNRRTDRARINMKIFDIGRQG